MDTSCNQWEHYRNFTSSLTKLKETLSATNGDIPGNLTPPPTTQTYIPSDDQLSLLVRLCPHVDRVRGRPLRRRVTLLLGGFTRITVPQTVLSQHPERVPPPGRQAYEGGLGRHVQVLDFLVGGVPVECIVRGVILNQVLLDWFPTIPTVTPNQLHPLGSTGTYLHFLWGFWSIYKQKGQAKS